MKRTAQLRLSHMIAMLCVSLPTSIAPTFAAPVLDQDFTSTPPNFYNSTGNQLAQVYTAQLTGTLAGVKLFADVSTNASANIFITTVTGGVPDVGLGSVMGAGLPPGGSGFPPTNPIMLSDLITFSSPIQQVAGTQYAIVLGGTSNGAVWAEVHGTTNLYPPGGALGGAFFFNSFGSPQEWLPLGSAPSPLPGNNDTFLFQTFVDVAAQVPEPGSLALLFAAIAAGITLPRKRNATHRVA